jgi:CRP/FNR family transcriptional regulator, cyclic AMP receptor protein
MPTTTTLQDSHEPRSIGPSQRADILSQSFVLRDLPRAELDRLVPYFKLRTYRRGYPLFHQGDPGESFHVIYEGRVKVLLPGDACSDTIVAILGPGQEFGELSLLDGEPRSATIVALEEVRTLSLSRPDFLELLRLHPGVVEAVLGGLARMVRRLDSHVSDLMYLDLRGRLAKKLLELGESHGVRSGDTIELCLPLNQEELASLIGGSRPRVNNLLGLFEDQGVISRRKRGLLILKPDALRRWACQ